MLVRFAAPVLQRLETEDFRKSGFADAVIIAYRRRLALIRAAVDERAFYALKSLHYEKLRGRRAHQRSMRLNRQFRLILEVADRPPPTVLLVGIGDYH